MQPYHVGVALGTGHKGDCGQGHLRKEAEVGVAQGEVEQRARRQRGQEVRPDAAATGTLSPAGVQNVL